MKQAMQPDEAAALIPDGAVLLIGGFMGVGSPHRLINALVELMRRVGVALGRTSSTACRI